MPLTKLQFQPGINKEVTSYGAEGGWYDSDKIRFRSGMPEKMGGWDKYITSTTLDGKARGILSWKTNDGEISLVIGTHKKVYVEQGGIYNDITPIRTTTAMATDPVATVNGNTTITITETAHGAQNGDYVILSGLVCTGLDDSEVNAEHVLTKINDDSYTVVVTTAATATGNTGGASGVGEYLLAIGLDDSTYGTGWGAGAWNAGTWNTARTGGVTTSSRFWYFDLWGEDLVFTHNFGKIYTWDASGGVNVRATEITQAPSANNLCAVTVPDRHLVAFGAHDGTQHDTMLVKWCSQEDYTDWTPTATNTAGSQLLSGGSTIIAASRSEGQTLIWTDTDLHSMQYIGPPYTFGFQQVGSNCAVVSSRAFVNFNGVTVWMGLRNFWIYDGSLRVLPSTVNAYVFDDINLTNAPKIHAATIAEYNEVIWFYCSAASTEVDRYVTYNFVEQVWTVGTMDRTSWVDRGVLKYPVGFDGNGQGYNHEKTHNADGVAMVAHVESGELDIAEGDSLMFMTRIIPDFTMQGSLDLTLKTRKYPNATQTATVFTGITSSTEKVDIRVRGRQASIRIESNTTDCDWRYGALRLDIKPDGRQ